jgi:hypothetical protein
MKKSKKMIIGLVLLAMGVIGILNLFSEFSSDLLFGSLICIGIGAVLIWLDKKPKKTTVATTSAPQISNITSTPKASEPKKGEVPDDFYKLSNYFESKQFSLVKTSKRIDEYSNRADNLSACDEGDLLFIEKEFLGDNYIVTTDTFDEIGELPKSAINFIEENCPSKIYGILDSCEEDENGKLKAKITVYLT